MPRALRIHHDSVDPVVGYSPYQAVFGRTRNLAALHWTGETKAEDARIFFERMDREDLMIAERRQAHLQKVAGRVNAYRRARPPYKVGDYVFLLKPKTVGGHKISTWWLGPYQVLARVGENSYRLKVPREGMVEAHTTQLKQCFWNLPEGPKVHFQVPPKGTQTAREEPGGVASPTTSN